MNMLKIDLNNFDISKRNEILNGNGDMEYWCQPDFAYKKRLHVYDNKNNEIGYVQYKILSSQEGIEYYDAKDNKIDFGNLGINKISKTNFSIKDNDEIVADINEGILNIKEKTDECLLLILGVIGE